MSRRYDDVIRRWVHNRVDETWKDDASCKGTSPDMWFPADRRNRRERHHDDPAVKILTKMAKLICLECPVQRECLAWALAVDERHGIYGGLTPSERQRLQKRSG